MLDIVHFSPNECSRLQKEADTILLPMVEDAARLFAQHSIKAVANDWLLKQPWKRSLALHVFGDLLQETSARLRILEVGGGLSALTRALAVRHDYSLIELATHEHGADYRRFEELVGASFVTIGDWSEMHLEGPYDVIIANDLFPNVDQRLHEFVEKACPLTKELRFTLTYYERTAWKVSRQTSGETLIVRPWGLREIAAFLNEFTVRYPYFGTTFDRGQLRYQDYENVLFTNRRNVLRANFRRDAA